MFEERPGERRAVYDLNDRGRRLVFRALAACTATTTSWSCSSVLEAAAKASWSAEASCWRSFALVASRAEIPLLPFAWRTMAARMASLVAASSSLRCRGAAFPRPRHGLSELSSGHWR